VSGVRRRFEPPIGSASVALGGARLMHQAAKRAGAAPHRRSTQLSTSALLIYAP
jgi:hypothetical protein